MLLFHRSRKKEIKQVQVNTVIKLNPEVIVNEVNEAESYAVNLKNTDSKVIRFSGVSAKFIKYISENLTLSDIVEKVSHDFTDISKETIQADLSDFIQELKNKDLIS
tara:strand:- start:123771 stop:124091 length:321 start_codon:yes stop_codon:yes gene_type:complete